MAMYKLHAPSSTSISDNDDDDVHAQSIDVDNDSLLPVVSPAQWSSSKSSRVPPFAHPSSHKCPIALLPPEVLIHILKHLHSTRDLYSALRVSRTWCECSVELLWHKPTFAKYDTLDKMIKLFQRPDQTFFYATFIRRLNFLNLSKDISDSLLLVLARCERLERLTLVNCERITGEALAVVLPKFSNLVAIDLSSVSHTSNKAIVGLASAAKRLQGINLAGCKKVGDQGVMALAESCPLLRRVKLSGLELLTDEPVSALAKSCPLLLEIDLNHCSLITDVSIRDIWTYSSHMREMRLSHCPNLTDTAFPSPRKRDYVNHDANSPFPQIHKSDELPPLVLTRSFEHLRMLDLTACALVTDEAIEGIISHAPKIRNLVLSKCSLLTDRSVENICRLGRHLHYLHLGHAVKITDRSVRTLARSCTRLRYIDFASMFYFQSVLLLPLMSYVRLCPAHRHVCVRALRSPQASQDRSCTRRESYGRSHLCIGR
jgi:F-box and leucine-rich repeat protein GRR1